MNTTNRIIDTIDTLVDDQLAEGPHDDYNVNRYDKCGHCGRDWHGLRITTRIEHMRIRGVYDENYRTDTDTSPVLCEGSAFIGPQALPDRIAPPIGSGWQSIGIIDPEGAIHFRPGGAGAALVPTQPGPSAGLFQQANPHFHRVHRLMRNMLDSLAAIMGMTLPELDDFIDSMGPLTIDPPAGNPEASE